MSPPTAGFTTLTSRIVLLPRRDVDTDQIIPARFLKGTRRDGLGVHLFADWPDAERPRSSDGEILLAGDNFGCGSSREHAAWALAGAGFRVLVSTSFADIFRANAMKNGLLPIVVDGETHAWLFEQTRAAPDTTLTIDLAEQTVTLPERGTIAFAIDPFAKRCLLEGIDELDYLLRFRADIERYERA